MSIEKKERFEKMYIDGKLLEKKPYVNGKVNVIEEKNGEKAVYTNDEEKIIKSALMK